MVVFISGKFQSLKSELLRQASPEHILEYNKGDAMNDQLGISLQLLAVMRPYTGAQRKGTISAMSLAQQDVSAISGVKEVYECVRDGEDILLAVETTEGMHYLLIAHEKSALVSIRGLPGRWDGARPQVKRTRKDGLENLFRWNEFRRSLTTETETISDR